jgi:hypothetical protein
MNLTLEQAMAKATKGPLEADNSATIWTTAPTQRIDGHVANCSHAAIDPEFKARDFEKANAVLLAHWYNVGPELVEAGRMVLTLLEYYPPLVPPSAQRKAAKILAILDSTLARANTVTLPD